MSIEQDQKVIQYLYEAQAMEAALVQTLTVHIAMTPSGSYRNGLEKHLTETEDHAERIGRRLSELGQARSLLQTGVGVVEGLVGQVVAMSKAPLDLIRGASGEEKLLKNAKDECASEGLEIATYTALERLAQAVDDGQTARLAASIRKDEERMLERLLKEIPRLTAATVDAEIEGKSTYDISDIGAADAGRKVGREIKKGARRTQGRAKRVATLTGQEAKSTARQARKVPGVARAEGEVKGAMASQSDLPIARYDSLKGGEVIEKLSELSQIDLAKINAYERKNKDRSTITEKISSLRGDEPWPGYDELSVEEVKAVLSDNEDAARNRKVREYERRHKDRAGVMGAAEGQPVRS